VYFYPSKVLLGTTPLTYELAPGRYKLKLVIGPKRGQRRYFQVHIKAGKETLRSFRHW